MVQKLYSPHVNQIKVHNCKAKNRVVNAGRRFGKTALGLNEGIYTILQLKNKIVWIILPHLKQAKEVYWIDPDVTKYFMPLVQNKILKKNDSDLSLFCPRAGSWLRLKGADNYESLRGSGLDLIIWDEVADVKPDAFDVIKPALADSPNHRTLYIGTPKGLNHFHDFALKGNHTGIVPSFEKPYTLDPDWMTFHFTSYDNMTWHEGSPEKEAFVKFINKERYEAEEKGKLSFFNQEYMASFEESAGRFFPKWSYQTHVIDRMQDLSKAKYIISSIDWGRQAPMAWYAHAIIPTVHNNISFNRIITFKEIYGSGKSPYEQAVLINKELPYNVVLRTYYDPSMDSKQDDGSISVADQFRSAFNKLTGKMPPMLPAANKRPSRWAALDNWMRIAPDGLPYWLITQNCINLTRTIPLMVPDRNNIEDIDTTLEDHAVDSASYAIQYIKWVDASILKMVMNTNQRVIRPPTIINPDKFATSIKEVVHRDWKNI